MPTVLVIDDDADIRAIVRMCLVQLGAYDVIEADGGAVGVRRCLERQPDLVLLDYMMPDLDGLQCFDEMRAAFGARGATPPPVVLMTARCDLDGADPSAFAGVLGKPFDLATLLSEVKRVVTA